MPEDNQIQTWFQPEVQTNPQIQQNNLVQNQQINQGIVQQNNIGPAEQNLSQSSKPRSSRLTKIVSGILWLLWIALIWLWVYEIFQISSNWYYSTHYSTRDIIVGSWILILGPLWIWLIILWILSYRTPNVDIYYHPTRLTKILSGIYRFLWIALIRAGLRNFSLVSSEYTSFWHILYVWWAITLCGILYIFLWRLLYNTKNKMHLWFSMLCALVVNIIFARILREFTDYSYWIDEDIFESFWNILVLFTLIYFSILTIRWIIKCRKFKKKWIINPKYLIQTPSKKKVWIITTVILLSIVIVDLIYGKLQWSKIPEIDESIFARKEHQTKLSDEEDALIQLKAFESWYTASMLYLLDSYYLYEWNSSNHPGNTNIWREKHTNECIIVNSWWNEYCGTWTWDKKTLERFLNNYYYIGYDDYMKDFINSDWYLSMDWKKVTIFEYIDKNEPEIRSDLQKLDKILSLDYNLDFPSTREEPFYLLPTFLQSFTRGNMVALQYYTLKKDWEMVMFIIKLEYKMVDILNNYWCNISHLISFVLQNVTDSDINSLIRLFPKDFRIQLSERYSNLDYDKEQMTKKRTKWEYNIVWRSRAKDGIFTDIWSNTPSLTQFMFHFPFLSRKDTNRFMDYAYYNLMYDEQFDFDSVQLISPKNSLYNYHGSYPQQALRTRVSSYNQRLENTIYHKEALVKNLESGKHDVWFGKLDWEYDPYEYERNRIPTEKELIENKIKKYSDIIDPCFWEDIITDFLDNAYYIDFWYECPQSLTEIKRQDDDEFWLKENLTEISQLRINYNEIGEEINECHESEDFNPNTCKKYYNEQEKNINNIKKSYIKLSDILENIKNKFPEINIENYFYIPEIK